MADANAAEEPASDGVLGSAPWPEAVAAGVTSQSAFLAARRPAAGVRAGDRCRLRVDATGPAAVGSWLVVTSSRNTVEASLPRDGDGKPGGAEAGRDGWTVARSSGWVVSALSVDVNAAVDSHTGHAPTLQGCIDGKTSFSSAQNACVILASSSDTPTRACTKRSLQWRAHEPMTLTDNRISSRLRRKSLGR